MMKKQLIVLLLFLVLMFSLSDAFWVTPFKVPIVKASVSSGWYYSNMGYRVEHNITGSPAGNQTNYQMKITIVNGTGTSNESVYHATHVNQSDFDDVRFTWYNMTSGWEEEIDYWCEEVNSGSNATFWVEIPEVSNVTDNTIYIYYGNNTATTISNVDATFIRVIDGDQPVVLALPVDEGEGTTTYDKSNNGNHGSLKPGSGSVVNENFTSAYDTPVQLEHTNLVDGTVVVTTTDGLTTYTEGADYTIDYANGTITVLSTGSMADATNYLVDYDFSGSYPAWVDGKSDKALSFDGVDDYVEVADDPSLDVTKVTMEAWFKVRSLDIHHPGIMVKTPVNQAYQMWVYIILADVPGSSGEHPIRGRVSVGGTLYHVESTTLIDFNTWYHAVTTYDGENLRLYINGILEDENTAPSGDIDITTDVLQLAAGSKSAQLLDGTIDEVRIYNRALNSTEISDLYNYYGYATTNYAGRVLVRKLVDPEPTHGAWGTEVPYVPVHDIAVVSVAPSSTEVVKGYSINILVIVKNEGTESETFNVTAHYDNNIIDTQTNIPLKPRTNKILTFTWNTTNVFLGNYNISAQASTVPGETDTDDNIFTDGTVKVIIDYPVAHFTYSPTNPYVNETVTFNATLSTPNGGTLINHTWDFGDGSYRNGVIVHHNYPKAGTYNVTLTVTDSEEANNTAWATITVSMHDISIISVTPSTDEIYQGQTMNISVIIQNNGNFTETFNVTIYANTTIIQTQTVSNLAPNNQTTLTFIWNTAKASPGSYTIKAETNIIPEEIYSAQTIFIHTPPSWYAPLVAWLIGIPALVWVGISILIIVVALFRLKIIKIGVERPLEPAEELQDQINRLLQPLAEKDGRHIPLQNFLYQLLEKNPPPETIEFLRNTFPIIIHSLQKDLKRKRGSRVRAKILKRDDLKGKRRKRAHADH